MKEELKYIITGIVRSLVSQGGLKITTSLLEDMSVPENWSCIDTKTSVITQSIMWCYQYLPIDIIKSQEYFLQIELQTEFKTVVSINVITNEENKIIKYN